MLRTAFARLRNVLFVAGALTVAAGCSSDDALAGPGSDMPNATLVQQSSQVLRTTRLNLRLHNNGTTPFRYEECIVAAEILQGSTWTPVTLPPEWQNCAQPVRTLGARAVASIIPIVPASLPAGRYQVAVYINTMTAPAEAPPIITFSNTFFVGG